MTNLDKIFTAWDVFSTPQTGRKGFWKNREAARKTLLASCSGDIMFSFTDSGNKDFAILGGCIMLAERS